MKGYRESFPYENIYIHNPTDRNPTTGCSNPQKFRYKYVYIWRAFTPTNKISKYHHAELSNKYRATNFYPLPKLRKGYRWSGPYLYGEYETWNDSKRKEVN